MSQRRIRPVLAAIVLGTALVSAPAGQSVASEAPGCTWQKTAWDLPAGTEIGAIDGYDGSRYAVGVTGSRPQVGWNMIDPRGTLWDDGEVVLRADGQTPHFRDVNADGLVVGDTVVDDQFIAVTIDHAGQTTALPVDPEWTSSSAWAVNNTGDIVGWAGIGTESVLVVWPGTAPDTYRTLPTPQLGYHHIADIDEQGRVIIQTRSSEGGGFIVTPEGQWNALVPAGTADYSTPLAIRDGRVVGSSDNLAAEWDAHGSLVRVIPDGATAAHSIGGNGTVAGYAFVGSTQRVVLWRDGVVVDRPIQADFALAGLSDDERTIVGSEARHPSHYRCS